MNETTRARRVYPPVYFLGAMILMACLHVLVPGPRLIGSPFRYSGLLLVAAGILMGFWAAGLFRRFSTSIKPFEESSALVLTGPYRLTRNPMYLGMVCVLVGVGLCCGTLTPLFVIPVFMVLLDRRFIRSEEALLQRRFGADYSDYKARVRRWV